MVYKTFIRVDKKNTFKIYVLFNDIFLFLQRLYTSKLHVLHFKNLKSKISKLNYDLYVQKSFILYYIKFLITRE